MEIKAQEERIVNNLIMSHALSLTLHVSRSFF